VRKSLAIVPARWFRKNVFHVCDGGRRRRFGGFGKYFATVSLLTTKPSFASSLVIRRRLHVGFSRAIRPMSATISSASGGRPMRRDFQAQNRAKARRCQPITVAGFTIASTSRQRDHTFKSTTQNARSIGRNCGRGVARCRIASCWRSARFSATRLARGRRAATSEPTIAA